MTQENNSCKQKNKRPGIFFMVVFALSVTALIKAAVTGESSFRTAEYTAESNPEKFWFDIGILILFALGSFAVMLVHYLKNKK